MRLLFLSPTLERSGAAKQLSLLATGLPRDEFHVHVACLERDGPFEKTLREHGVSSTIIGRRLTVDPFALRKLKRLVADQQPDVVHSWSSGTNSYLTLAVGRSDRVRAVASERSTGSDDAGFLGWLNRRRMRRVHRLVCPSKRTARFWIGRGFPEDRLAVIPDAVEPLKFTADDRRGVLSEFDIPSDHSVVGYVGQLARKQHVPDLIWAMQLLRQLRERVHFLIVGDGAERRKCEKLARHMGCDHLVRFAGQRDDAVRLLAAMDVFWFAGGLDSASNSLMEAMSAGIPVVVADTAANRELVENAEQGYVVPVGDSVRIAQWTDRILADNELRDRFGKAGRSRMRSGHDVSSMIAGYSRLYRELQAE